MVIIQNPILYEPQSKLLKGGVIRDYLGGLLQGLGSQTTPNIGTDKCHLRTSGDRRLQSLADG